MDKDYTKKNSKHIQYMYVSGMRGILFFSTDLYSIFDE